MYGAVATVGDQLPHSLHVNFTRRGDSDKPVDIVVERTRDGAPCQRVRERDAGGPKLIDRGGVLPYESG